MEHSKNNDGPYFDSVSQFLMESCSCDKVNNGHWSLKCCLDKCNECKTVIKTIPNLHLQIEVIDRDNIITS